MRTLMIAAALVCLSASTSMAQSTTTTYERATLPRPPGSSGGVIFCPKDETISYRPLYRHYFVFARPDGTMTARMDVTPDGLKLDHAAPFVEAIPGSSAADARFSGEIEMLRTAALAHVPVALMHDGYDTVTGLNVQWWVKCGVV